MKLLGVISAEILLTMLSSTASAAPCESLSSLSLPETTITMAQTVAPGAFVSPEGPAGAFKSLPAFCRVAATLKPTSDSEIQIEVWMPASGWNGNFIAVGNGGWAGTIFYPRMIGPLARGYAVASTNTGHSGTIGDGSFALGHPEKLIDFGYRAVHEMTVKAKAIVAAFYGNGPKLAYWNGCSTGGRQALKEAQMFPNDYDGIIAGDPANRTALAMWIAHAVKDPASYIPPGKYPIIHQAALAVCDAQDGVKDGLISDPMQCSFDPAVLLCPGGDSGTCLTAPQLTAAKKIYAPAVNPHTGKLLSPPLVPGTELGWGDDAGQKPNANILDQYKYVVFKDPNWDWKTFDFDRDATRGDLPENLIMNATDPNLAPFFSHGGKLLLYQGWSDPRVPALQTINYYQSVVDAAGGRSKASNSVRLFVAPGMGHCGGGDGPNVFDKVGPLERWVEQGKAPEQLIASHATAGKVDRTRPLCPYPQIAKYKGTGSIDEAANFVCAAK
jgi:feruloyl esterase